MHKIIEKEKTNKIFIHSVDDPHPDHRAVFNSVKDILDKLEY